ncbi:hypothetical protein [Niallia sp. FSL M8-0099]|uniref:hypothetical protein n=1 Tax=Niallia sp. FSL M8-0099 TaxID=2954519 RepID=UPI0030FBA241
MATKKITCTCCGKSKAQEDFYTSRSYINKHTGRSSLCKECIWDYVTTEDNGYDYNKMLDMLQMIDRPFIQDLLTSSIDEAAKGNKNVFKIYMKNLGMVQNIDKRWQDSEFDGFNKPDTSENTSKSNMLLEIEDEEIQNLSKEDMKYLVSFWGKGFDLEAYIWLQTEYEDWVNRYECDSKGMENLIKEICKQQLDINNRRALGEKVDQQLKTLQDLLGSSNLKPVQETGANAVEQETFGTLIKKYENEKPIPEPDEKWKDVDKVSKYIRVFFLGHLSRMLGIKNEYEEEYWDEIDKLTVEEPVIDDEEIDNG